MEDLGDLMDKLGVVPLSQIHPSWGGYVDPKTLDAVKRGIELERARLAGLPFLTLRFDQKNPLGELKESLALLEGFSDEASAIRYVEQLADETLTASLAEPAPRESTWRHDESCDNARIKPCLESSHVRCIHLRSFKLTLDDGRSPKSFQFEVLAVNLPEGIGSDLFPYYDAGHQWYWYLYSKGRVKRPNQPLSQIHPRWEGSLTALDFDLLTRGIERERARLSGLPFLTLQYNTEYDYDGEDESLQLLEGFSDKASAIQYVDQLTEQVLTATRADPDYQVSRGNARVKPCRKSFRVRCIHLVTVIVKIESGGYKFWKNFQFEVLSVNRTRGIGPDLFAYYDAQREWERYLKSKGRE